jgi:methyl-accepting chemotaxis protein
MKQVVKSYLRSRWIVDRGLQFNLVTRIVIFVLFVFCVLSAALFAPLVREIEHAGRGGSRESVETLLDMLLRVWPAAILCLVVAVGGALFISHRLAGPLVRVKRVLRFLTEGHFPRALDTRPRDYFKEEVDVLNQMVASVSGRVEEFARVSREMRDAITACEQTVESSPDADLRDGFARITEHARAVETLLEGFSWEGSRRAEPAAEEWPQEVPAAEPALDGAS